MSVLLGPQQNANNDLVAAMCAENDAKAAWQNIHDQLVALEQQQLIAARAVMAAIAETDSKSGGFLSTRRTLVGFVPPSS